MKYMKNFVHISWVFLQIQLVKSEIRYCPEAVASAESVSFCPDSKEAWNIAALRKNCSGMAAQQKCTTVEKFKYHCVINGFRNKFMEVCAPKRIIFGHCVEFNAGGGVIQDQMSAPCNSSFPKCDDIYRSTEAYKYPDCYALVSGGDFKASTTTSTIGESDTGQEHKGTIIGIISAVVLVVTILVIIGVLVLKFKRSLRLPSSTTMQDESTSFMLSKAENGQAPKVNKRTPSLPSIGDRYENEKNENKRTERHVNICVSKNI